MTDRIELLSEVRHSVKVHILLAGGPSAELCMFLLKLLEEPEPSDAELALLGYAIISSLANHIHRSLETRILQFPDSANKLTALGGKILMAVDRTKRSSDLVVARRELLQSLSQTMAELSAITGLKYPTIELCGAHCGRIEPRISS